MAFLVVAAFFSAFALTSRFSAQMLVNIETVRIGDPGNAAETRIISDTTSGCGAVGYEFNLGKYAVTMGHYSTFLNSVASVTSDSYIVGL